MVTMLLLKSSYRLMLTSQLDFMRPRVPSEIFRAASCAAKRQGAALWIIAAAHLGQLYI